MKRVPGGTLVTFFALAYAVMWTSFITVAAAGIPAQGPLGTLLLYLGTFAPSLAALWLTARAEGSTGIRALLGRALQWRVAARWYVFAVGYIPVIKLTVALVHRVATGAWPRFGNEPWYIIPVAIAFSTPFQAGEEIGWRGYALPRMAARLGLARASILLGFIWGCWHLPQFFIPEADTYGQSFFVFVLQVTALSVAMAWLYARTNGSLLLVMLMHAAVNNAKDIVPSAVPGATNTFGMSASLVAWLTVTFLWICAACFLARMPALRRASRLLVIDPEHRVLLFQYEDERRRWWATPGGGVEGNETFEAAAAREAEEEFSLTGTTLMPVWTGTVAFTFRGQSIWQVERYFLVRASRQSVALGEAVREAHRREGIVAARWWSLEEIETTSEQVFPEDLCERLRALATKPTTSAASTPSASRIL